MEVKKDLILASKSPRRQELLKIITPDFRVMPADVDETKIEEEILAQKNSYRDFSQLASDLVMSLAAAKAETIADKLKLCSGNPSKTVILASDTIVVLEDKILGKPSNRKAAIEMLTYLSGKTHSVFTGVHILASSSQESFYSQAYVDFYPLDHFTRDCIEHYVDSGAPLDKAGSYGIQDEGAFLVKGIRGDFFTVMGLPLAATARRLYKLLGPNNFFD